MVAPRMLGDEIGTIHSRKELNELLKIHVKHGAIDVETGREVAGAMNYKNHVVRDAMTPVKDCFMLSVSEKLNFKVGADNVFVFFYPFYCLRPACPLLQLPPFRNSAQPLGSRIGRSSPLPATVHAFIFVARRVGYFLTSSTQSSLPEYLGMTETTRFGPRCMTITTRFGTRVP